MKTLLLLLTLTSSAFAGALDRPDGTSGLSSTNLAPAAKSYAIKGIVKQRTDEGLLVAAVKLALDGRPAASMDVWLKGVDMPEGSRVNLNAVRSGTYSYTTLDGAARKVDAFVKR